MNAKSVFLGRPYELTDITVQLSVSLYLHLAQRVFLSKENQ